jgi:hypothetical protein
MKFKGYNLHTCINQHGMLIKCNIQVKSTNTYYVNNNINTVFID